MTENRDYKEESFDFLAAPYVDKQDGSVVEAVATGASMPRKNDMLQETFETHIPSEKRGIHRQKRARRLFMG